MCQLYYYRLRLQATGLRHLVRGSSARNCFELKAPEAEARLAEAAKQRTWTCLAEAAKQRRRMASILH